MTETGETINSQRGRMSDSGEGKTQRARPGASA